MPRSIIKLLTCIRRLTAPALYSFLKCSVVYFSIGGLPLCYLAGDASAADCNQVAAKCFQEGGGPACYENSRLAACQSTAFHSSRWWYLGS